MILTFGKNFEDEKNRKIGEPKTIQDAFDLMKKDLKKHNTKFYYLQSTVLENCLCIDFGSYTQFYYLSDLCEDWHQQWMEYDNE